MAGHRPHLLEAHLLTVDVANPQNSTVADLLTPRQRTWTYALLAAVAPGYAILEATTNLPIGVAVGYAVLNGLGFGLAGANTPKSQP